MFANDYSYSGLTQESTGPIPGQEEQTTQIVPYDRYEIVVRLTRSGRFLGIAELRVKKDFLSPGQRVANSGYLDVDEFYQE